MKLVSRNSSQKNTWQCMYCSELIPQIVYRKIPGNACTVVNWCQRNSLQKNTWQCMYCSELMSRNSLQKNTWQCMYCSGLVSRNCSQKNTSHCMYCSELMSQIVYRKIPVNVCTVVNWSQRNIVYRKIPGNACTVVNCMKLMSQNNLQKNTWQCMYCSETDVTK